MKFPPIGSLVLVFWEDSSCEDGWLSVKAAEISVEAHPVCKTAGWISRADENGIYLVCSAAFNEDNELAMSGTMYLIPSSAIRKIVRLQVKKR